MKVTISWSGGKDSALALYKVMNDARYEVVSLHTIINEGTKRVGMHGVPEALIDLQAARIGIPLIKLYLEQSESHAAYEALMKSFYHRCKTEGIEGVVFGDIFLEDLKKYREDLMVMSNLRTVFPLWKVPSSVLISEFISLGFKTIICAANAAFFTAASLGRLIDLPFVRSLPVTVDCCGENGEFHTYVYDGPVFSEAVKFTLGEVVEKKYQYKQTEPDGSTTTLATAFLFQDILSVND